MPLDPDRLMANTPPEVRQSLTRRDVIIYALGVGAEELPFIYEENLRVLPTMPVVMGYAGFIWQDPAFGVDWRRILHGETSVEIHAPLPVEGDLVSRSSIGPIFDKGAERGAVVYQTRTISTAAGDRIATVRNAMVFRGDGGFGGSGEGQPKPHPVPDRAPDLTITIPTAANQAAIYRLCGDTNPLHVDPAVATQAGFPGPILHGLASFGVAGRALLRGLCDNDPAALRGIDARFTSPVFPGETLTTEIWREGAGQAAFRTSVRERGVTVLNNGKAVLA